MGSLSFCIYAVKIKTVGTTTYDNVFSTVIATSYKNKWVTQFRTGLSYNDSKNCSILDYSDSSNGKDESQNCTISTGVTSDGVLSANSSYSYNPSKMCIYETLFSNRVRWTCYPQSNVTNASWKVQPGILLKKSDGKNNSVKVTSYVSYFRLSGSIRTYTIEKNASCSITFKNHKKV